MKPFFTIISLLNYIYFIISQSTHFILDTHKALIPMTIFPAICLILILLTFIPMLHNRSWKPIVMLNAIGFAILTPLVWIIAWNGLPF
ncbi:hypothetical protein [Staphylococcus massiliensis]|uniref:Uncharacterized protein n=1 Tax=Staphylococcus massiliensis S46 TaxID=1229783 RepID=K9AH37_9STAP|nr:hypothetical protein [Staphylococcus massiliensis]EKU46599.1 hypothetical protein C273_09131 [Staphylococcus massiliensis S46]MCG3399634.1 hypothetical protein [Staphylococcus massiliensis]MCG3400739.1 hypothetical protein [Staphylococcus massiliensis]MCG3412096.1 hypothetical protein [Staphylococcus massiliensis]PNZ98663.1 hypothetical protein CD133_08145 [Staphylococcus massiliensis CCUG 55927]